MGKMRGMVPERLKASLRNKQWFQDHFGTAMAMEGFRFKGQSIRDDIENRYDGGGALLDIYTTGAPELIHKWHHYLPIYERHFSKWREERVRFIEIGVSKGGSLSMWRRYFGEDAILYGIDINPECAQYDGVAGQVRIGSQDDPAFLMRVVEEMGGVDVILDDGSHVMKHVRASLEVLFPLLENRGVYMIEDLHTAYWRSFGGGLRRKGNFFNYIREIVDDMHRWYHVSGAQHPNVSAHCNAIHIYDSICVIEKSFSQRPTHSKVQIVDADLK